MKKSLFLMLTLTSSFLHAQIGVNTSNVTSTLTVNGSISGKYKEIRASNYQIQQNDYNIAYLGGNETKGVFVLPKVKNGSIDYAGRIYYIKNLSQNKTLQIKASESEYIRFGGNLSDRDSFDLFPGRFVMLMANNSTGQATWDLNILGLEETPPEVKTVEYLKYSLEIDIEKLYDINKGEGVIRLGNLSIGYHSIDKTTGDLMLKFENNTCALSTSSLHSDAGGVAVSGVKYVYTNLNSKKWNPLPLFPHIYKHIILTKTESFSVVVATCDTNELYKINIFIFPGIGKDKKTKLNYFLEKIN